MILKREKNHPDYYRFRVLDSCSGLRHAVFTRNGGVSESPFDSLNVAFSTGDSSEKVAHNRRRIARCLNFDQELYLNQVHGRSFAVFRKKDACPAGEPDMSALINIADGVITDIPGILLVIQVADCQAVILYDRVKQVVANIHSGWRGSLFNIIGSGVDIMVDQFLSEPDDIIAAVSPSLGPCCAEFINYRDEIPERLWRYKDNYHCFDFWRITRHQLMEKGVLPEHIQVAGICTKCASDHFFSYRKEKITGRFAVVAGLI